MRARVRQVAGEGNSAGLGDDCGGQHHLEEGSRLRFRALLGGGQEPSQFQLLLRQEPIIHEGPCLGVEAFVQSALQVGSVFKEQTVRPCHDGPSGTQRGDRIEWRALGLHDQSGERVDVAADGAPVQAGGLHQRGAGTEHRIQDHVAGDRQPFDEERGQLRRELRRERMPSVGGVPAVGTVKLQVRSQGVLERVEVHVSICHRAGTTALFMRKSKDTATLSVALADSLNRPTKNCVQRLVFQFPARTLDKTKAIIGYTIKLFDGSSGNRTKHDNPPPRSRFDVGFEPIDTVQPNRLAGALIASFGPTTGVALNDVGGAERFS